LAGAAPIAASAALSASLADRVVARALPLGAFLGLFGVTAMTFLRLLHCEIDSPTKNCKTYCAVQQILGRVTRRAFRAFCRKSVKTWI
jgi:hypothetical protein